MALLWALLCVLCVPCVVSMEQHQMAQPPDAWFPAFHIRPPQGHVNDPNGPLYDPRFGGMYHLFFQWCHDWPCHPGPGGKGWGHFASRDLATWVDVGYALRSDGVGCPDFVGVFSGS
eukprot:SAG25_NODE_7799_length_458_cov_1.144847_1_plen_116_part_01